MTMTETRLTSPKVVVIYDPNPAQADGDLTEYTVQTDNRDSIQWDITRPRKTWPTAQEAPLLWLTFMAWHALRRSGVLSVELDTFLAGCVEVRTFKKDGTLAEPGSTEGADLTPLDPTLPVAPTGS